MAVDTLGHLLAAHVTPADEQERTQVEHLCEAAQRATGQTVELVWTDQGYTGEEAREAARHHTASREVAGSEKGLRAAAQTLNGRAQLWVAGAVSATVLDYERLPEVLSELHFLISAVLMLPDAARLMAPTDIS